MNLKWNLTCLKWIDSAHFESVLVYLKHKFLFVIFSVLVLVYFWYYSITKLDSNTLETCINIGGSFSFAKMYLFSYPVEIRQTK